MKNLILLITLFSVLIFTACENRPTQSASGVGMVSTEVKTQASGLTTEQEQIKARLDQDNKPGSIKHLYIISSYSGQVLIYSTVKGKVTSSGKRLTPTTVNGNFSSTCSSGMQVWIGNSWYCTQEVLQDDGTFGSSAEYIYWFDSKGIYHQQYITGGMILHVSSEPMAVKSVVLNLEQN